VRLRIVMCVGVWYFGEAVQKTMVPGRAVLIFHPIFTIG
jgi:hypothetical protein